MVQIQYRLQSSKVCEVSESYQTPWPSNNNTLNRHVAHKPASACHRVWLQSCTNISCGLDNSFGDVVNHMLHKLDTHLYTLLDVATMHWGGWIGTHAVALLDRNKGIIGFGLDGVLHFLDRALSASNNVARMRVCVCVCARARALVVVLMRRT